MATDPSMKIVPPYTPELLPSVQEEIVRYLAAIKAERAEEVSTEPIRVLEFGSGWSTIWFAQMGCQVVSFEHDREWWNAVVNAGRELELEKSISLFLIPPERFTETLAMMWRPPEYDLVLVDCIDEQRLPCLGGSMRLLRPGGMMVLDDSHWPDLQPAFERLYYWNNYTLEGMHRRKTGETHYHRTTFFIKPTP